MIRVFPILGASLLFGCTVDLGVAPDASPCRPQPAYFVTDVWPRFLDDGKCGRSGCHTTRPGGRGYFRLSEPGFAPAPFSPIEAWPEAWQSNYHAAIQQVRCDDPLKSRLLTLPMFRAEWHPGGTIITNERAADQLFRDWIAAPLP